MRKLIMLAFLGACTMQEIYSNAVITQVDGRDFFVSAQPASGENVYLAGPNDPTSDEVFFAYDFSLPAKNVRAIEQVTGCVVNLATIKNVDGGTTYAAVNCQS